MGTKKRAGPRRRRLTAEARRELIERAATEVFAEHGYHRASIDEIARRSGVTPPVVYDHFSSKKDLHKRLLERHYAELGEIWRRYFPGEDPPEQRLAGAIDAWFAYVQNHPYAWRMLFRETSGEPDVQAAHREVQVRSRAALLPLVAGETGSENIAGSGDAAGLEMAWEVFRAVLQGLALWWYENQHIPRDRMVSTAMNALWVGFERVRSGERWEA
ncbi:MAG: TetR/AcrR family transcriptional regulator [Actinomycetota bacterium]